MNKEYFALLNEFENEMSFKQYKSKNCLYFSEARRFWPFYYFFRSLKKICLFYVVAENA